MSLFPIMCSGGRGIDGSRVLSHLYKENNAIPLPEKMIERWEKDRIQIEEIDTMMYPFGYGDGGGGATRDELEMVRRCANLEGMPKTVYASPQSFFKKLEESNPTNVFTGDLYLAWHRGTYTSQAHTKLGGTQGRMSSKKRQNIGILCVLSMQSPGWMAEERHCRNYGRDCSCRSFMIFCREQESPECMKRQSGNWRQLQRKQSVY